MICPQCKGQGDIHQIIYGFPTEDFDFDIYESGGCVVSYPQPNWRCRNCGWEGVRKPRRKPDPSKSPNEKLGRFFATRAADSLKRDQRAKYHWGYLSGQGMTHCTCGLIFDSTNPAIASELSYPEANLDLHPIVFVKGHRQLPSCKGHAISLIVKLSNHLQGSDYLATALCQGCRKVIQEVNLKEAQEFVHEHEQSCGNE